MSGYAMGYFLATYATAMGIVRIKSEVPGVVA
jgi:hypothetical protein